MPHALLDLQGLQKCAPGPVIASNGGIKRDLLTGADLLEDPCGRFTLVEKGTLNEVEFDQAVYDLTNFLTYIAEPMAEQRKHIGRWVLLFLLLLLVPATLLAREYAKVMH